MNGVTFGEYHSFDDLSLILSNKEIGEAEPKIELIEVEGADEPIDFTEFFGDVKFSNRTLKFDFSVIVPTSEFDELYSDIQNKLNGRRMKITLDSDPDFYYSGRISVKEWTADKTIGKVTIEADCNPYKLKIYKTIINVDVNGEKTVVLKNLRRWVVPLFTTTASLIFEYDKKTYSVNAGTFTIPDFVLKDGANSLVIKGDGNVKIEYQEGGL